MDIEDYTLINGYGPTECTIYSTYYRAEGHYDGTVIGRPLPNYQLLVIDKNMNLVPPGVPGELLIAGKGLSFGYLNRPELNEEKFIDFNLNDDISFKLKPIEQAILCVSVKGEILYSSAETIR